MFFACFSNDLVGKYGGGLYYDNRAGHDQYFKDTFSPGTEMHWFISFHVYGETYAERKECVRNAALDYQSAFSDYCFSYSEIAEIESWFSKNGKRYGLLNEFRENAIC